jgi:hypothetical protein
MEVSARLRVYVDLQGAALVGAPGAELARILRRLAEQVEGTVTSCRRGTFSTSLHDLNGNAVGLALIQ